MNRWILDLINLLLPPECHVCGTRLAPHERFICSVCLSALPRTGYHRLPMNPMEERFAGQFPFLRASGHFFYSRDSALSSLIHDMKYRHFPDIGTTLGRLAASELFPTGFFEGADVIVPVPMHFLKQARRGYNQTHKIAEGISEATGLPVCHALKATRSHRTQTSLTREQRLANTESLFTVARKEEIEGRGILLVDDICTTGATITAAANAILSAIPESTISLFTIAVTF